MMTPIKKLAALAPMGLVLVMAGCSDFLTVPPVNRPTVQTFYQNEDDLVMAVNAAYSTLQNRPLYGRYLFCQLSCMNDDESNAEAAFSNTYNFIFNDDWPGRIWGSLYQGIYRSNLVIGNAGGVAISDTAKYRSAVGEAYFLRAMYYSHLARLWEAAPIIDTAKQGNYPVTKSSQQQIYSHLAAQIDSAVKYLPETPIEKGRATDFAAYALLAKAQLQQKNYQEAAVNLRKVIDSGKFKLATLDKVWTVAGENSDESIFEVQFARLGGSAWGDDSPTDAGGTMRNKFYGPAQETGYMNFFPSDDLLAEFEAGDPRFKAWIWGEGDALPSGKTYDPAKNKSKFAIRKGNNSGCGDLNGGFEENTPLIRYADILLMYAECLINGATTGGTPGEYIDQVRRRAFSPDTTKTVAALMAEKGWDIFTALKHERRIELCFEYQRYDDLLRWGDAAAKLGNRWADSRKYLPIPQGEIDISGSSLTQNPGY